MLFLETLHGATELVSEASFCPTAIESHQGHRVRKGKIAGLRISILSPGLSFAVWPQVSSTHPPISGSQFSKDKAPFLSCGQTGQCGITYLGARRPRKPKGSLVSNFALWRRDGKGK